MQDVQGKCAFITGGASGIGLGMARAFAEAGMQVAIADIQSDALDGALDILRHSTNAVHGVVLDVTDRPAMARAADEVEEVFGKVHVLCNNAGVANRGWLDRASYDDWDWVLGVNLGGVINGVHSFVPRIKAHGEGGHVINTASMAGLAASVGNGVYCTSKFAVVGLSEGLRQELAPHKIGVSVLCPGSVATNFNTNSRNRPARFATPGMQLNDEQLALMQRAFEAGSDPLEIGRLCVQAIKDDRAYILPHSEFKEGQRKRMEAILADFSDAPPDAARVEANKYRREAFDRLLSE